MFFRKKKTQTRIPVRRMVVLARQAADGVITYAKSCHPNEGILILQGKHKENTTFITGLVIPPFSTHGLFIQDFQVMSFLLISHILELYILILADL